MYRAIAHKRRTYFIYTLFESAILEGGPAFTSR
jgi:hypothetical protein